MKFMNNKKPNSQRDHILYKRPYVQPPGIRATCHLCKPPKGFKSIEELQKHELQQHRVWKG